ncbi:hypothetical protein PV10_07745 [Exophiala mesophila]|uniref:Uncharacterized protein n=1 Tax=Exophiala mesophila TaxID=212818 RepID=A0A0D1ZUH5_EXOME|nr:uncharacterized protein PV10_07745 [Exophiala mesophila]KIV90438.1 hypothetical protein PV10_07745 [Exophiala mesophila]
MSKDKGSDGGHAVVRAPAHPVPQLQKPFEESMMESAEDGQDHEVPLDAMARRTMLLDAPTYNRVIAGRWKQKPGEKYHPLWKLVAQMSFGMHLLALNLAISEEEVMKILQSHVDDIDGFLERTTEDFDLAQSDIHERIRCLKLPLAHGEVFDRMLEDGAFRASILDGNEKIEHVISRTKRAAKDALKDVQKGFDATNTLEKYLTSLNSSWHRKSPEHEAVLVAMLGNVEGWRRAFLELHLEGNKLAGLLKKLSEVVAQMERRAATVSRNMITKYQRPVNLPSQKPHHMSQSGSIAQAKPLPTEPGRRQSSRKSSQSTNVTGFSSRPGTGHKSSHGMTSIGQTPESKRNRSRSHDTNHHAISDAAKELNQSRRQQPVEQGHEFGGLLVPADLENPIELPADLPEDLLRQAPVSVRNRLSMTLGIDPKTKSDHRISSVYYPRALGELLKSPESSHMLYSPQHATSNVATPVSAVITSPVYGLENRASHTAQQGRKSQSGLAGSHDQPKPRYAMPTAIRGSARASVIDPMMRSQRMSNPAFTSHPAVMAMASPPVELPAEADGEEMTIMMALDQVSKPSSIRGPGSETEKGARARSKSLAGASHAAKTSVVSALGVPALVEEKSSAVAGRGEARQRSSHGKTSLTEVAEPSESNQDEEEIYQDSKESQEPPVTVPKPDNDEPNATKQDPVVAEIVAEKTEKAEPSLGVERAVDESVNSTKGKKVDVQAKGYVAELEANTPGEPTRLEEPNPTGPVELEAPFHNFALPPRPIAASSNPDKEVPRASIRNLDDFFKLPSEQSITPGRRVKEGGRSSEQDKTKPLKLTLAKVDGKTVPIRSNSREEGWREGGERPPSQLLKSDVVADIIGTMSYTPPGSPLHQRGSSGASHNSAQRWSHRSTRSLGPSEVAPPPPAPGGRPMVNPDFASAGQFEGERKQKKKKKISIVSKDKWRLFFQNGNSRALNPSQAAQAEKAARESGKEPGEGGSEMMSGSGKDVVWFKGERKSAVGAVSRSSG